MKRFGSTHKTETLCDWDAVVLNRCRTNSTPPTIIAVSFSLGLIINWRVSEMVSFSEYPLLQGLQTLRALSTQTWPTKSIIRLSVLFVLLSLSLFVPSTIVERAPSEYSLRYVCTIGTRSYHCASVLALNLIFSTTLFSHDSFTLLLLHGRTINSDLRLACPLAPPQTWAN